MCFLFLRLQIADGAVRGVSTYPTLPLVILSNHEAGPNNSEKNRSSCFVFRGSWSGKMTQLCQLTKTGLKLSTLSALSSQAFNISVSTLYQEDKKNNEDFFQRNLSIITFAFYRGFLNQRPKPIHKVGTNLPATPRMI